MNKINHERNDLTLSGSSDRNLVQDIKKFKIQAIFPLKCFFLSEKIVEMNLIGKYIRSTIMTNLVVLVIVN